MEIAVGITIEMDESIFSSRTFSDDYKTLYRNDGNNKFLRCEPIRRAWALRQFPSSPGEPGFWTLTMTGSWTYLLPTDTSTHPWTSGIGAQLGRTPQLFRNLDGTKFQEVPPATGSGLADVIPARGAAFGTCSTMATQTSS